MASIVLSQGYAAEPLCLCEYRIAVLLCVEVWIKGLRNTSLEATAENGNRLSPISRSHQQKQPKRP